MEEKIIMPVRDNKDKQRSYAEQMRRYVAAIKGGFYFEAMLIDYATLEDRLYSMIYHMGFVVDRKTPKIWRKTKPYLSQMLLDDSGKKLSLCKINDKIFIIRAVLTWVCEVDGGYQDNKYLKTLKDQCERLDIGAILEILNNIENWCKYRNEIIHALLNKNVDSIQEQLQEQVLQGMEYARFLDSQVKLLKKGNRIRKSINAPTEKTGV